MEAERFWSRVGIRGADECWAWLRGHFTQGYGAYWWNKKVVKAHRIAWELTNGAIPDGLIVRHKCRGLCVNPAHLELGTHTDNQRDRVRDGTDNRGERHAKSKLTNEQVRDIRRRVGQPQCVLAVEFGVSQATISNIIKGKKWRHI